MNTTANRPEVTAALLFLEQHYQAFYSAAPFAQKTGHPVPMDTRGWSQILASILCGVNGLARQKGADLADGSDVKGANTWEAIDTPRFNGVLSSGRKTKGTSGTLASLDSMPNIYFILWDTSPRKTARCRIWVVRPQHDQVFRSICNDWYRKRAAGTIRSDNFQLHPPRFLDSNVIRNTCGNLEYPLYFCAERGATAPLQLVHYDPSARVNGACRRV